MVSFQSVAIVRKHPGRVMNRTESTLSAWRALTKVAAKWKISTHWYTKYPLERKLTSYELQNGNFSIVWGKKNIKKIIPAFNYNPQTLDHWREKLCCRCWKEVMGKSWLLRLMANVKERNKNVQRGIKQLSDKQKGFPAQRTNIRKVFKKDRGRSRLKVIWDEDCS